MGMLGDKHMKCKLYCAHIIGPLTGVSDHLLSITNGRGGNVEGCKNVSAEHKEKLVKDYDNNKKTKQVKENKNDAFKKRLHRFFIP